MNEYVTCRVRDEHFAIALHRVREIINVCPITSAPQSPAFVRGLINLRGQIVTILEPAVHLGFEPAGQDEGFIIILRGTAKGAGGGAEDSVQSDETIGLLVDEIGDVLEVAPERVEPPPANLEQSRAWAVSGVVRTADCLFAVLDIRELLRSERELAGNTPAA